MKEKLYKVLPNIFQNVFVSIYNIKAYRTRYGGDYRNFREEKEKNRGLSLLELRKLQEYRYKKLIDFAIANSEFYRRTIGKIEGVNDINNIRKLPIVDKETLRNNIADIVVKTKERLDKSKTGGTTGKSLEVQNFSRNSQERFAFLDDFRSRFGYELGKRTAWFSGKDLLTSRDIKKKRFWKTDFINHVRYYSTFHIKDEYLGFYVENLIKYKPEYLVGFPSTMLEIAKCGLRLGYDFPEGVVKAIFPTAESVTPETRDKIELFFKAKIYDQYASSEGAPFIFECVAGNLHLELQSGVFEVLDDNDVPTQAGRLVVTSFTNEGTPLIRYDIGDSITLADESDICSCGNHNPIVKEILGRSDDFVYSPENGKINLGNVSNTLKDTKGIIKFQVLQNELDKIVLYVIKDDLVYSSAVENKFLQNWRDRMGNAMGIEIKYVTEIPVESSGKFRIVKNNIKHLL